MAGQGSQLCLELVLRLGLKLRIRPNLGAHHVLPNPWKPRPPRALYSEDPLRPNISFQTSRSTDASTDRSGLGILGRDALTARTEAPCDSPTPEGFSAILLGQVRLSLLPWRLNADRGVREGTVEEKDQSKEKMSLFPNVTVTSRSYNGLRKTNNYEGSGLLK